MAGQSVLPHTGIGVADAGRIAPGIVPAALVVEFLNSVDVAHCGDETAPSVAERCAQVIALLHGIQVRAPARSAALRPHGSPEPAFRRVRRRRGRPGAGLDPQRRGRTLAHVVDPTGTWRGLLTDPADGTLLDHGRRTYRPPTALADHVTARDTTSTGRPTGNLGRCATTGSSTYTTRPAGRPLHLDRPRPHLHPQPRTTQGTPVGSSAIHGTCEPAAMISASRGLLYPAGRDFQHRWWTNPRSPDPAGSPDSRSRDLASPLRPGGGRGRRRRSCPRPGRTRRAGSRRPGGSRAR
jgi:hypothetical protein